MRIVTIRKLRNKLCGACVGRRPNDFLFGRIRFAIGDIRADGVIEQQYLLADQGNVISQALHREVADILSVDSDLAAFDIVESWDKIEDRRFSCARRTNQRNSFAGLNIQIDATQGCRFVRIAEMNVFKPDLAPGVENRPSIFAFSDIRPKVKTENTRCAAARPC